MSEKGGEFVSSPSFFSEVSMNGLAEGRTFAAKEGQKVVVDDVRHPGSSVCITVSNENRATVFARRTNSIAWLRQYMQRNYLNKNVNAAFVGTMHSDNETAWAVYVEDGFLRGGL